MKQISFSKISTDPLFKVQHAFGGTLMRQSKFRHYRPLNRKYPLHLVLRSTQARGPWSFLVAKNYEIIKNILKECGFKYGVKVAEISINCDHIHMLIWITNRPLYNCFIRTLTGLIALRVTGVGTAAKLNNPSA